MQKMQHISESTELWVIKSMWFWHGSNPDIIEPILSLSEDLFVTHLDFFKKTKAFIRGNVADSHLTPEQWEYVEKWASDPRGVSADLGPLVDSLRQEYLKKKIKTVETLDEASTVIDFVNSVQIQNSKNSQNLADSYLASYHEAKRLETLGQSEFIRTGFKKIDQNITLMRGHVTVLMARSSIGKSALALNLAMGAVEHDSRVLFITLEMNENEVMNRVLSYISGESNTRYKYRSIDPTADLDFFSKHYKRLHIIAPVNCNIHKLAAIMCCEKYDMIVIDYLGYLSFPDTKNRNEAIGDVTRKIKEIAKQQKCHVLLLSQVRRGADRKNTVPDLEDLRDSGNIEQDADEVIALNRESRDSTEAVLVIRKGRTGVAELAIPLTYQPHLTKFEEQASIGNMWSA